MPISKVYFFPASKISVEEAKEYISESITNISAWDLKIKLYLSDISHQKTEKENKIWNSDTKNYYLSKTSCFPSKNFVICGNSILTGDEKLEQLIEKTKALYIFRHQVSVEGITCDIGNDLQVRIGSVSSSSSTAGLVIEFCHQAINDIIGYKSFEKTIYQKYKELFDLNLAKTLELSEGERNLAENLNKMADKL
ncbi:hypothetical protein O9G_005392 [Rozella allomycis CSF55]|uniref:Mediator of RNA polymerase II transcription subunit 20 n=1 Tax=Rozella allomycis (strain CSF55) TaxID=988480 RepID=A0A075ATW3_ROZAC|nr:hypothetical protein O9G_005392 [Rozella allomycis CSF55]|eukprot:EPZ32145.1 hypothetical protein O9G_005392 [Rozella allomycis CSF55]